MDWFNFDTTDLIICAIVLSILGDSYLLLALLILAIMLYFAFQYGLLPEDVLYFF